MLYCFSGQGKGSPVKLQNGYLCSSLSWLESSSVPLSKLLVCALVPEKMPLFSCILTVLSLQIEVVQSPCLGWQYKNYFRKRTVTFRRKEPYTGWRCNVEFHTAPGLLESAHLPKWRWLEKTESQLNDMTADLGKVTLLKEFSSTGLLVFPPERIIRKPRMKHNMVCPTIFQKL